MFSSQEGYMESNKRRPFFNSTLKSTSNEKRNLIQSGFGFDRVKRVMKYPIFDTHEPTPV